MKVDVDVLGKSTWTSLESRRGRPWLPVPTKPYGFCGRKATFEEDGNKM